MNKTELTRLTSRLLLAEKWFTGTQYHSILYAALTFWNANQPKLCEEELNKLPSPERLLLELLAKLKGKSVYKTIMKIQEGSTSNDYITLKGLSSLLTHVTIEMEKGNKEYGILLPALFEKISDLVYKL